MSWSVNCSSVTRMHFLNCAYGWYDFELLLPSIGLICPDPSSRGNLMLHVRPYGVATDVLQFHTSSSDQTPFQLMFYDSRRQDQYCLNSLSESGVFLLLDHHLFLGIKLKEIVAPTPPIHSLFLYFFCFLCIIFYYLWDVSLLCFTNVSLYILNVIFKQFI